MNAQMMRVISSPSSSTIGVLDLDLRHCLGSFASRASGSVVPWQDEGVFGGGSIQLARVFGIRIGVEPSWFLVLFLIIWSLTGYYGDLFPGDGTKAFVLAVISALLFFV